MKLTPILAIALIFALAPAAHAQKKARKSMPEEGQRIYKMTKTYFELRERDAYRELEQSKKSEVDAEVNRIFDERKATSFWTSEHPLNINLELLSQDAEESIQSCPPEIQKILREGKVPKNKDLSLDSSTDAKTLAACKARLEALNINVLRWANLFINPDVSSPPETLGVFKTNSLIETTLSEGVYRLRLLSDMAAEKVIWLQEVINHYWNIDPRVRIEIHNRKTMIGQPFQLLNVRGYVPAANGIPATNIKMDFNVKADDVLAHEFGHVLGFKDCYVEKWDENTETATYYEMDYTNIMCSMRGTVLPSHIDALIQAYGPQAKLSN